MATKSNLSSGHRPSNLYSVNPANGDLTVIGSAPVSYDDFGAAGGILYAIDRNFADFNLYSINAATGAATLIGPTGLTAGSQRSLSSNSGTLYFADGPNIYTINTSTGLATLLGNMGGPQLDALLVDGGVLYGTDPANNVYTIDQGTGVATFSTASSGAIGTFFGLAPNPLPSAVPEPAFLPLLALAAVIGFVALWRRRGRA